MIMALAGIGTLLLSTAILVMGNGLQGTLIAIRANVEAFSDFSIGLLQSSYYLGFVTGCFVCPLIVARAGHIRTFAAMASVASVVGLVHVLIIDPVIWWVLRFVTGLCFAGLTMVTESWINERSTNQNRGRVLSVYFIVNLVGTMGGQLLLLLAAPKNFVLFAIVSILISLSLVPVTLTSAMAPAPIRAARLHFRRLFDLAPLGVVGCFSVGMANSAVWGLGPVFAQDAGFTVPQVAYFIGLMILGGALLQWPLGRLSDRYDRRKIITGVAFLGAMMGVLMSLASTTYPGGLMPLAIAFGASAMTLYSLSVAHVNDFADTEDFVKISGGLLMIFGVGAIIGPLLASAVMEAMGYWFLFVFTGTVHMLLGGFGLYRIFHRVPIPPEDQEDFVMVPRSSPEVFKLHPVSDESRES